MIDRDFGDQVTPLIARRWPKTFELLLRGCTRRGWPALIRMKTSINQWTVAIAQSGVPASGVVDLTQENSNLPMRSTGESVLEMQRSDDPLRELIPILGGDYLNRILKRPEKIVKAPPAADLR